MTTAKDNIKRTMRKDELAKAREEVSAIIESIPESDLKDSLTKFVRRNAALVKAYILAEFSPKPKELSQQEKACIVGRKAQWGHIAWCCDRAIEYSDCYDERFHPQKAHRWLGFVQGFAWMSGCCTLNQLIDESWHYPQATLDMPITNAISFVHSRLSALTPDPRKELSDNEKRSIQVSRAAKVRHLLWCAEQAFLYETSNALKANQWLGFIQGAAWALQIVTIEELRKAYMEIPPEPESQKPKRKR